MKYLVTLLLLSALTAFAQPFELPATSELLVKYRRDDPAKENAVSSLHRQHGAREKHRYTHFRWSLIELPADGNPHKLRQLYRQSGLFEEVQTPRTYYVGRTPNDPLYSQLWGMAKIQAPLAWDTYTGSGTSIVAVVDTGISFTHIDVRGNVWTGPNGEHGYTCIGGFIKEGGLDDHYHGTHCAGTIAAEGNNSVGVAGVNWRLQLIAFKFLSASGSGSSGDAALCYDKIIELKRSGVNIRVTSNSWGGPGYDAILEDAFREAQDAGILNICAAGNDGQDLDIYPHSPGALNLDGIISVVASDQNDNKASFSNYGAQNADLAAPGVSILSCKPGDGYQLLSGTSMATPHVAGVVAAMFAINPSLTYLEARNVLLDPGSYDVTAFKTTSTGGGRLNFFKCLNNPKLQHPPQATNLAPVITITSSIAYSNTLVIPAGQTATVTATATDPNNDPLIFVSSLTSEQDITEGTTLNQLIAPYYRKTGAERLDVLGMPLAIDVSPTLTFSVSDGHGGGASKKVKAFVYRDPTKLRDLSHAIQNFTASYDPSTYKLRMRLNVDTNVVPANQAHFAYCFFRDDRDFARSCCFNPNEDYMLEVPLQNPGVNTGRALLMDNDGNFANSDQVVISLGRSATPPKIQARWNTTRGPAVLQLTADMTGTKANQFMRGVWNSYAFSDEPYSPVQTFAIELPGTWAITLQAFDTVNHTADQIVQFISVLPVDAVMPPPPTNPPPSNPILTPPDNLTGTVSGTRITLNWTDQARDETKYEVWQSIKGKGPWGPWQLLANLGANSQSYTRSVPKATYQYKVRACNATQCGGFSGVVELRVR